MLPEEKQKLLDYIKTAIDVETDIETQNQIKAECTSVMEKKRPTFQKTPSPPCPPEPIYQEKAEYYIEGIWMAIIGAILSLIVMAIGQWGLIIIGGPLAVIGLVVAGATKDANDTNKEQTSLYERKKEEYEQTLTRNAERDKNRKKQYETDMIEWSKSMRELTSRFVEPLNEMQEIRTKLYDKNMIYPKYQNLPALTSIYEYFITGRCEELTGPHGAYNMYEDEMRKDTVISQLSTVIANLEQIKQNQYMLYQQVKTIQKTASVIGNELAQIRGYTAALTELSAMNAYYNAVSARNSRIMTAYHLLP